jgi:abequosyltransferase
MSILLSFCIATRNRGDFIAETLRSIASQATDQVEIVVLDGASTDNTQIVVRDLQATVPGLRYIHKEKNGGVDRDYDEAVGHAKGEYCWLMSDDDLVMPGAVARVLKAISEGHSLIIANSEVRSHDFSQLLDRSRTRFLTDRTYSTIEHDRLFNETSAYLTYIGAVIMRRDIWCARQRSPYFGSYFIHVGVIYQAPLPSTVLAIAQPLISVRFGNTQWRPKEFEIRMIRWTELVWSLEAVSTHTRLALYRREPWTSIKSLFFYRAKGTYGLNDYQKWIKPRTKVGWVQLQALCLAVFPGPIANVLGLLYCSLPYRDSNIHFLDMKASRFFIPTWLRNKKASLALASGKGKK